MFLSLAVLMLNPMEIFHFLLLVSLGETSPGASAVQSEKLVATAKHTKEILIQVVKPPQ